MASLAAHAISSSASAATHAHGAKTHGKAESGDRFADMLAAADDAAAENQTAPAAPAPARQTAQPAAVQDTTDGEDSTDSDIAQDTAEQLTLAAPSTVQAKPQPMDASADKAADKSEDVKPTANDNDGDAQAALPQPVMPAPQPQIQAQTQSQDQNIAAVAANAPAAAPLQAGPQNDDADQDAAEAATATQAAITDKATAAAAKSTKPTGDFKKMLDGTKLAAAKTATADAAQTQNADATKADAAKADAGKAEAQLADARPVPPASAHADNQPNNQPVAVNAPQQPAANNIQSADAPAQAMPAAMHHAPNLQGLAVEISARSQSGAKQFDIRLDPPELGRVEVRLSIDSTGKAEAHLTADRPQTLDLLQKDAPALTRALREAGLDVAQDGLNFSLRQQQHQAGQDQPQFHSGRTLRANFAAPSNEPATTAAAYGSRGHGLLDIRV